MRHVTVWIVGCVVAASPALAAENRAIKAAMEKGVAFLKTAQSDDGTWSSMQSIGVTGLVVHSLLVAGVPADDPAVAKGLKKLANSIQPDGSIGPPNSRISAYETSIAVMTLAAANKDGQYDQAIQNAIKFLRTVQFGEARGTRPEDSQLGGAGYNTGRSRPDLSNTHFFLEAFEAAGISPNDQAVQDSIKFLSRCQNLAGPANPAPEAAQVNDGGFQYTVVGGGGGDRNAGAEGGLRSYGSMTYAGFKSMLYAGLTEDDPRVKASLGWIRKHYSVAENPGMGPRGLFYYYYLFGKAMNAGKITTLVDDDGARHDWKQELGDHLLTLQLPNGSWVNKGSEQWQEGDPNLVTAYALFALSQCLKP